ncbi:MAG: bifunctional cytidylyltransferase/SDR family oxidoreductase [Puniceicoccales bacterium]|jgi:2-C-methyl-D-erythritol 4-phosphate cytidylyltransferase|nr:bifunctional cytidylyltransferase/SDR family oxidoreductase [Puniceicoccales bacterium]
MKVYAIVLASGIGKRVGIDIPKQFLKISGKTVLEHSIEIFENSDAIDVIIAVVHGSFVNFCKKIFQRNNYKKIRKILIGGATRQESSRIGIEAIGEKEAKILVHDAVRPLLSDKIVTACIAALDKYDAVDVAIPTADTIIEVDESMDVADIPAREFLMRGQTPQAFKLSVIRHAHEFAMKAPDLHVTDDCGLVKAFNLAKIHVIEGDETNVKITYPIDIFAADKLFQLKRLPSSDANLTQLAGKVLVVFGASSGIGKSIHQLARKHGARVCNFSRSSGTDVRKKAAIGKALKSVCDSEGRIDFVVNTAGTLKLGELLTRSEEDIRAEVETNYFGCVNIALESHRYLKQTGGMLLFFTSSSYTRGRALYSIYSSTKAAIVNLTQALAEEWSADGIRINVINPTRTATPMRSANFGEEPKESLLSPEFVAEKSLATLLQDYTGQVIDVSKHSQPQK